MGVYSLIPKQNKSIFSPIRWYLTFGPSIVFLFSFFPTNMETKMTSCHFGQLLVFSFHISYSLFQTNCGATPSSNNGTPFTFVAKTPHGTVAIILVWRFRPVGVFFIAFLLLFGLPFTIHILLFGAISILGETQNKRGYAQSKRDSAWKERIKQDLSPEDVEEMQVLSYFFYRKMIKKSFDMYHVLWRRPCAGH